MNVNRIGVMNEEGALVESGSEGEIVVRGACVKRYLDPALTDSARRNGWHRTGDVGFVDADGYLYVTGRIKDVINVAGFKIAAGDVERVIAELSGVQECAVVAAPDAVRGETIRAVVTLRPGASVTEPEILAHCRKRLGAGRAPSLVECWPLLPRTPAGKIDKHAIRAGMPATPAAGV